MSVRGSARRACAWVLTTAVIAAGLVLGQAPDAGASIAYGSTWLTPHDAGQLYSAASGVTDDGRWIAFSTNVPLDGADTNDLTDAYVRDTITGATTLLSIDENGAAMGGHTTGIAADRAVVAWQDQAGSVRTAHVTDLDTGSDTIVGTSESWGFSADLSADGTHVLVRAITGDRLETTAEVVDVATGARTQIGVGETLYGRLSADGATVLYQVEETPGSWSVYRWHAGVTDLVAAGPAEIGDMDRSGTTFLYRVEQSTWLWQDGTATQLATADDNAYFRLTDDGTTLFVTNYTIDGTTIDRRDVATGTTTPLPLPAGRIGLVDIAADGSRLLLDGGVPGAAERTLAVHDLTAGTTTLVCCTDIPAASSPFGIELNGVVSTNGQVVLSTTLPIDPADGPTSYDVYLWAPPATTVSLGVAEVTEESATVHVPVSLSAPSPAPVTIRLAAADSCASSTDAQVAGEITVPTGATEASVPVTIADDGEREANEVFAFRIIDIDGAGITDGLGEVAITDDDGGAIDSVPSISVGDAQVIERDEGRTPIAMPIALTEPTDHAVTLTWSTRDYEYDPTRDNADGFGADFETASGSATISPGETEVEVTVNVVAERNEEPTEHFTVGIADVCGATVADSRGTATIIDDDTPAPRASIADAQLLEGNEGSSPMTFTITLDSPPEVDARLFWNVYPPYRSDAPHAEAGIDFAGPTGGIVTVPAGQTTASVQIPIVGDEFTEPDEILEASIQAYGGSGGVMVVDHTAVGTIVDDGDDGGPQPEKPDVSIGDVSVVEGSGWSGTTPMAFPLTLSHAVPWDVTIGWGVDSGTTATFGSDVRYPQSNEVIIPAGQTTGQIVFEVLRDDTQEPDEQLALIVYGSTGSGSTSDHQGIGTIVNDDTNPPVLPVVTVEDGTGFEHHRNIHFAVTLSHPTNEAVVLRGEVAPGGTATSGEDYEPWSTGYGYIEPGQTTGDMRFTLLDDSVAEPRETVHLRVSATNATVTDPDVVGTIIDNDAPPPVVPQVSVQDATASEHDGVIRPSVVLSEPTTRDVTVHYATTDGTAVHPADYSGHGAFVTVPAGATQAPITIQLQNDTVDEPDELFYVDIIRADGATVTDARAAATIEDDDEPAPLTISVRDATVGEGNQTTVVVEISRPSDRPVSFRTASADGSAGSDDYGVTGGIGYVPAGETSSTAMTVYAWDDELDEADETLAVTITSVSGAEIADGTGTVTILDDDEPAPPVVPDVSVADSAAYEDDGVMTFTITLSEPTTVPVEVTYSTGDSTSSNGARHARDYRVTAGTAQVAPGASVAIIDVPLVDDVVPELDESFRFLLQSAVGGTVVTPRVNGTIHDDDPIRVGRVI